MQADYRRIRGACICQTPSRAVRGAGNQEPVTAPFALEQRGHGVPDGSRRVFTNEDEVVAISKTERDFIKSSNKTHYWSSKLLPKKHRNDIFALYYFVRTAKDFVHAA